MQQYRIGGAVLVALVACGIVWGQDAAKPTTTKEPAAEKLSGRLPNNFGKIGLSEAQKQKVYALQAKYGDQIDVLTKQLDDLKAKRDGEIDGVLTAEQKEKLKGLLKTAAEKKASAKAEKPDEGK